MAFEGGGVAPEQEEPWIRAGPGHQVTEPPQATRAHFLVIPPLPNHVGCYLKAPGDGDFQPPEQEDLWDR